MLIDVIAGTRPNFVKVAAILRELKENQSLEYRLIHTGQHYDVQMSEIFFDQLQIPRPDVSLEVGSGTQAEQTGKIMMSYEALLLQKPCDFCLVVGDVNSTLAATLAARKLGINVGHVEAGIRSGDLRMPEEINRIVTDSISTHFFVTTRNAEKNLLSTRVDPEAIHFVGNTMIDTLRAMESSFAPPAFWEDFGLSARSYVVLTMHRPSNVDDPGSLARKLSHIAEACGDIQIVFPAHPRTHKMLGDTRFPDQILIVGPAPYLQFNYLVRNAMAVITDSGGITEEATVMNVPCLSLRDTTERPETVEIGTNVLIGDDMNLLRECMRKIIVGSWKSGNIPERWDGQASQRIVEVLNQIAQS